MGSYACMGLPWAAMIEDVQRQRQLRKACELYMEDWRAARSLVSNDRHSMVDGGTAAGGCRVDATTIVFEAGFRVKCHHHWPLGHCLQQREESVGVTPGGVRGNGLGPPGLGGSGAPQLKPLWALKLSRRSQPAKHPGAQPVPQCSHIKSRALRACAHAPTSKGGTCSTCTYMYVHVMYIHGRELGSR